MQSDEGADSSRACAQRAAKSGHRHRVDAIGGRVISTARVGDSGGINQRNLYKDMVKADGGGAVSEGRQYICVSELARQSVFARMLR
jgi:hypothetical protein